MKMVRKIATQDEATDLIAKYHGDLNAKEEENENFKIWKIEQEKKGVVFTLQPWDDNYGHYDEDTDDSIEMKKRKAKRKLFSKPPLQQLFHQYVPVDDTNDHESKSSTASIDNKDRAHSSHEHENNEPNATTSKESTTSKENPSASNYVGPVYYRDPYETDTDQSVGESDDDGDDNETYNLLSSQGSWQAKMTSMTMTTQLMTIVVMQITQMKSMKQKNLI